MAPFPAQTIIPAGWSLRHRVVAAGGMNARVRIDEPGTGEPTTDPDTGDVTDAPATPRWVGAARIQARGGQAYTADQAEQLVTTTSYLVQLDESDPANPTPDVRVDWSVVVTDCSNDARLAGRALSVADVQYGSERFTRDLICTANLG